MCKWTCRQNIFCKIWVLAVCLQVSDHRLEKGSLWKWRECLAPVLEKWRKACQIFSESRFESKYDHPPSDCRCNLMALCSSINITSWLLLNLCTGSPLDVQIALSLHLCSKFTASEITSSITLSKKLCYTPKPLTWLLPHFIYYLNPLGCGLQRTGILSPVFYTLVPLQLLGEWTGPLQCVRKMLATGTR